MRFPKPYSNIVQRLRVPSGFLLAAAFAWLSRPTLESISWGMPLCAAGLALRGWAAGHLLKNENLTTSGPYAWVRNPLYIGTLLTAMGFTVAAARLELAAFVAIVFIGVYLPVMQQEEDYLRVLFPDFDAYASRVNQLLPKPPPHASTRSFSWAVYWKNREQKAFYGFLMVLAFFVVRMLLS